MPQVESTHSDATEDAASDPVPNLKVNDSIICPACRTRLPLSESPTLDDVQTCSRGHRFRVRLFNPPPSLTNQPAKPVMSDGAACAHHPSKQAITTCAGSGDYICSLCAVPIQNEIYSFAYLETSSLLDKNNVFSDKVPRPDRTVRSHFWTAVLTTFFCRCFPLGLILYALAWPHFLKHFKLREENSLYAASTKPSTTTFLVLAMLVWSVLVAGIISLFVVDRSLFSELFPIDMFLN